MCVCVCVCVRMYVCMYTNSRDLSFISPNYQTIKFDIMPFKVDSLNNK